MLLVNNVRDREVDRRAGRRTLAGRLEPANARRLYAALMLAPFAVLSIAWGWRPIGLAWLALPLFVWLVMRFARLPAGPAMNVQLARTSLAQSVLGALFCLEVLTY